MDDIFQGADESLADETLFDREETELQQQLRETERKLRSVETEHNSFRKTMEGDMTKLIHERNELRREVKRLNQELADGQAAEPVAMGPSTGNSSMDLDQWLRELTQKGVEVDGVTHSTVVLSAAKDGKLDEAHRLLKEMEDAGHKPTAFMYTQITESHLAFKDLVGAERSLEEMVAKSLKVRASTYAKFIALCMRRSDEVRAQEWLLKAQANQADVGLVVNALRVDFGDTADQLAECLLDE